MPGRVTRVLGSSLMAALLVGACGTGGAPLSTTGPTTPTPRDQASSIPSVQVPSPTASATLAEPSATPAEPSVATAEPSEASLPTIDPAAPTPIIEPGEPAPPLVGLVGADGPFDLADVRGHPTLLFFGYTHCPDVCPMTVGELVQVLQHRPETRVVFVTVDPERDTQESLAEWTRYLREGFLALTGSASAIRETADAYDVRYARVDTGSAAGYSMSHTAFVHLIDADGRMRVTFPFGTGWASMVRAIDALPGNTQEVGS